MTFHVMISFVCSSSYFISFASVGRVDWDMRIMKQRLSCRDRISCLLKVFFS